MKGTLTQDICDINKIIDVNDLTEVTNPVIIDHSRYPTDDGLLSFEIFGRSQSERKNNWSYINLKEYFIHPMLYKILLSLEKSAISHIVAGIGKYYVNAQGILTEDKEDDPKIEGGTGIKFLFDNYDKIKFRKTKSAIRDRRIKLMKSISRDELFVDKWLVIPAFYRDMNFGETESKDSVHEITEMYADLLRMVQFISAESRMGLDIITNSTRFKIQKMLVSMYNFATGDTIAKKDGKFRQTVLGKSVDYGARLVISAPPFHLVEMGDMPINMTTTGVPLATVCSIFYPYVFKYVREFFDSNLANGKFPVTNSTTGEIEHIKIKDYDKQISNDYIKKNIKSFVNSYHDRLRPISIELEDNTRMSLRFTGRYDTTGKGETTKVSNRPMTWTDLLFISATEAIRDKLVLITRYPLEDYFGIFPSKIHLLSTRKTMPAYMSGKFYPYYPDLEADMTPQFASTYFVDTLQMSNLFLKGLGADYDGDQVSVRGIFSQEANAELLKIIYRKSNIINISGVNMRKTERESIQAFYNLTKARATL